MDLVEKFITDCEARGLTHHTIETYKSNIIDFLKACPEPSEADPEKLRDYLASLRSRNLQGSTLHGYFSAINTFYEFLIYESLTDINPIPSFRVRYLGRTKCSKDGETRQLISVQDMKLLIRSAASIQETAILLMLVKTGLRRGELLDMKVEDLNIQERTIRIPAKAKRTNRTAFMDDELQTVMISYLEWRSRIAKTSYLWISNAGGRIHKDYPGMIIALLAVPLHLHDPDGPLIRRLTPHCFRHFFTSHLFRAGMNPQYIMWLRGDSMGRQSWQIYNHIDPESVRIEYLRCIPRVLDPDSVSALSSAAAPLGDRKILSPSSWRQDLRSQTEKKK